MRTVCIMASLDAPPLTRNVGPTHPAVKRTHPSLAPRAIHPHVHPPAQFSRGCTRGLVYRELNDTADFKNYKIRLDW